MLTRALVSRANEPLLAPSITLAKISQWMDENERITAAHV